MNNRIGFLIDEIKNLLEEDVIDYPILEARAERLFHEIKEDESNYYRKLALEGR